MTSKLLERIHPAFDRIASPDAKVEELGRGYTAAEGPVWRKEHGHLVFSDHRDSKQFQWTPGSAVKQLKENTRGGNGQTRDLKGRLIVCERIGRRISRFEDDGEMTVIASRYRGLRLNSPNDVVVKSDGAIYFTDPLTPSPEVDFDRSGVYRLSPDCGHLFRLIDDLVFPNGLAFTPDEKTLYIIDTQRRHIRAFDVTHEGFLARGSDRVFFQFPKSEKPGLNDGMKVDVEGNVYCTGPGGVWVIEPSGRHIGTISTGADFHTNLAWGGDDWRTLFMTTRDTLCRIQLKIAGVAVPARKPSAA